MWRTGTVSTCPGLYQSTARKAIHQDPRQIGNQDPARVVGSPVALRHVVHGDGHGDPSALSINQSDVGAEGIESAGFVGDGDTAEAAAHAGTVLATLQDGKNFLGR